MSKKNVHLTRLLSALAIAVGFSTLLAADEPGGSSNTNGQPNIIVIMADDLGFGDLSCYGATSFKTPHIDQLAAEGRRFTSGYCSASTCTPTRYSMLTGRYAFRDKETGIAPPSSPAIIKPGVETLPSILQRAGYETAVIGKWHLGLGGDGGPDWNNELKPGPLEIGFDSCFLLPTTNDRVPQVYVKDHRVLNLDPKDPLWVGNRKPNADHPTGITHRDTLKMDWSHGHNSTIHNGISFGTRIWPTNGWKSRTSLSNRTRTNHFSSSSLRTTSTFPEFPTSVSKAKRHTVFAVTRSSKWIGALAS